MAEDGGGRTAGRGASRHRTGSSRVASIALRRFASPQALLRRDPARRCARQRPLAGRVLSHDASELARAPRHAQLPVALQRASRPAQARRVVGGSDGA